MKDRLRSIAEMESRYDGLQVEKRQLESSINKIPLHGRVDRNNRRQKVFLSNVFMLFRLFEGIDYLLVTFLVGNIVWKVLDLYKGSPSLTCH